MKRALVAACAAAFALAGAGSAAAGIEISSLGKFSNGQPTTAQQFYCGYGTTIACSSMALPSTSPDEAQVRWGNPFGGTMASRSGFTWLGSSGAPVSYETPFLLGTLTHFNFPIAAGTGLSNVDLTAQLRGTDGTNPLFARDIPITMNIEETENTINVADCKYPSTVPCDDRISWTLPAAQSVVPANANGGPWVLSVLGFSSSPTDSTTTDGFFSQEQKTNAAYLWGSLGTVGSGNAHDDGYSTIEDVPLSDGVAGNDASGGAYSVQTPPSHGTLTLAPSGGFTYTPAPGYVGPDSFIYLAAFGNQLALARADIDVQPDTTKPLIVAPDLTVEATEHGGAHVTFAPTASDPDDAAGPVDCGGASGGFFALGVTTVTCSSTDTHGNTATATFHVTVTDTTKPSISCPPGITVEATQLHAAFVTPVTASASDIATDVTVSGPDAGTYPLGTTTVVYTATDGAGNTSSCTSTITVVDTTKPSITCPAGVTVEATGPAGAFVTPGTASATDIGSDVTVTGPAAGMYPLGTSTVTYTATDEAGNRSSCTSTISVVDTTAPSVTVPADITVAASSVSGATVTFTAAATDVVAGALAVTCDHPSGSLFAPGATVVTCSATDEAGNTGSGSFTVTVNSAGAMLNDLWLAVQGLPPGNSLPAKIKNAKADFAAGDISGTCSMLAAFISEVQAQSGKKLTTAQAADLIARARAIRTVLGC